MASEGVGSHPLALVLPRGWWSRSGCCARSAGGSAARWGVGREGATADGPGAPVVGWLVSLSPPLGRGWRGPSARSNLSLCFYFPLFRSL